MNSYVAKCNKYEELHLNDLYKVVANDFPKSEIVLNWISLLLEYHPLLNNVLILHLLQLHRRVSLLNFLDLWSLLIKSQ